ncbi:MAG: NAD(+) synthase [Promethearchaeota archaeon]
MAIDYEKIKSTITNWLQDYLEKSGCTGFIVAISGGIDSSVAAVLCRKVTNATLGLILPCSQTPDDAAHDAQLLAEQFDIEYLTYDLTPTYDSLLMTFGLTPDTPVTIPLANIKARLRMIALYYEANHRNRLVVGTGNRTELMFGFFTKYGDGGADLLPLGDLLKHEVQGLGAFLGIPEHICVKTPSPGLWPGQTDEGELGASYDQLDDLVSEKIPQGLTKEQIKHFQQRIANNAHKRALPPICQLSKTTNVSE